MDKATAATFIEFCAAALPPSSMFRWCGELVVLPLLLVPGGKIEVKLLLLEYTLPMASVYTPRCGCEKIKNKNDWGLER